MVHEVAAAGFDDPADYEAARPSYPAAAVAWFAERLGLAPGRRVLDVAAGTGKLTRLLVGTGAEVIGIEPVPGMRATLRTTTRGVAIVAATAEALPFAHASCDAVTVAQAWHWFDHDRAVAEAARVVRSGGGLGLCWNARDRSVPWVNAVWSIMDRVEKNAPWRDHENWRDSAIADMPGFAPPELAEFRHAQAVTPDDVVRRVASVSHVAVLPERERTAVLDEVRKVIATHPDARERDTLEIPYRVDCIYAARLTSD